MADAGAIAVAALVFALHCGAFLLVQALSPAFWPVPVLNGLVAGAVILYLLMRAQSPDGALPPPMSGESLVMLAEAGVLSLSLLRLGGATAGRGPHWSIFAVHALLSLGLVGYMLDVRLERLFG